MGRRVKPCFGVFSSRRKKRRRERRENFGQKKERKEEREKRKEGEKKGEKVETLLCVFKSGSATGC